MDQRIQEIGSIIHQLPTDNLKMLHSLIKHLKKYVIFLLITIYFYSISYYSMWCSKLPSHYFTISTNQLAVVV